MRLAIDPDGGACSFCGVPRPERRAIVTNPDRSAKVRATRICDECIKRCAEHLGEALAALRSPDDLGAFPLPPADAPDFLDRLTRITDGIDEEYAARGMAFLPDVLRVTEPAHVREPDRNSRCAFCARRETEVARLFFGPEVFVCAFCVLAAARVHSAAVLRDRYAWIYDDLVSLLFRHDPVRINFKTNTDEYAPEVRTVLPRLETCSSVEDVAVVLHEEFTRWFTATSAGPKSIYDQIAPDVWSLWTKRP